MAPAEHQPIGHKEERGVVVTALRKTALTLRRAWILVCRGLALLSFIALGAATLFWTESFFAKYEPSDIHARLLPLVIVSIIVGVPASLVSMMPTTKSQRYFHFPAWIVQATLVLFLHAVINVTLSNWVSAEGQIEQVGGNYFVANEECFVRYLTPEEAHVWLGLTVAAFTSMFAVCFFLCGMSLWTHFQKLRTS
ncbi:MAG TPA: hypothetical protein VML01_06730 [Bryobacterales bacterium]|nr:hypothetical protein [Bryobacterales bacterium]